MQPCPFCNIDLESNIFKLLQRLGTVIYDHANNLQYVNHVRRELFCKKKHNLENLPPTEKMHFFCMLTGFYFRLVYGLQQLKKTLIRDVSAILLYVRLQKLGEFTLIVRKY
jgi:hypothetical protein